MQIAPIRFQNTNFEGKIQPSKVLSEIRGYANSESISRFDALEKHLSKINDNIVYDFARKNKYKMIGDDFEINTHYELYSNKQEEPIFTVISPRTAYSSPEFVRNNLSKILGIFVDFFENKFNPVETELKPTNKIKEILDNTV